MDGPGRRHRPPKAVQVNGIEYPSLPQAAKALAVHHGTLRKALINGKAEGFEPGPRPPGPLPHKVQRIFGVEYPSARALALQYGITPQTARNIIRRGDYDRIAEIAARCGPDVNCRPVTIRGVDYPSRTAAAKAFGVTIGAISKAARMGTLDLVGTGQRVGNLQGRKA